MAPDTRALVLKAWRAHTAVPALNVPYLPMMAPIVKALRETDTFGLIQVARLEWTKFEARGLREFRDEYDRAGDPRLTRLHLDHVPVIDEDGLRVDYEPVFAEAVSLGYGSVMVDGSRLPLEENMETARRVAAIAAPAGVAVEAELGAVMGHESGPLPPYDEIFRTGRGFTDPAEAGRFVRETGVDWLSVAIGNIHGAISAAARSSKKVEARLALDHLDLIQREAPVPLVLHGGSGIRREAVHEAIRRGIAKVNVATVLRQAYEAGLKHSAARAAEETCRAAVTVFEEDLAVAGSASILTA